MADFVNLEVDGGIGTIRLDRPPMNALNAQVQEELRAAALEASQRRDVRAVVIYGGPKVFAAGADIKEMATTTPVSLTIANSFARWERLACYRKPLIAAVRGVAVGAGVTMLPYFDFVVAASDARFLTPFTELGVPTEGGSSLMLPALVGPRLAARMLMLSEWVDAGDALSGGLVSEVVDSEAVLPRAEAIARRLVSLPAAALRSTKQLLVEARRDAVNAAFARERAAGLALYTAPDFPAALARFNKGSD